MNELIASFSMFRCHIFGVQSMWNSLSDPTFAEMIFGDWPPHFTDLRI